MLTRNLILACALGLTLPTVSGTAFAEDIDKRSAAPIKVVYHVSEDVQQASRAIGNIRNQLKTDPTTKIVVVTYGAGIDFLLEDAENASGGKFAPTLEELKTAGVEFRVCNNTLLSRKIDPKTLVKQASIVPSGVVEVSKLQAREGFVYFKP
ncbi:MAG: DsrE family protein [Halothiobacillaceae bacterium]